MRARALPASRLSQAIEVGRGAFDAIGIVVPATEVQHGGRGPPVASLEFRPVPPGVLGRMRQPLEVVRCLLCAATAGRAAAATTGSRRRRTATSHLRRHRPASRAAARVRCDVLVDPRQPRPVEDAVHVEEPARRGECHRGRHREEMRRRLERGKPLHRARVRQAVGPDSAIRPGLPRRPLDRVVTVGALLPVRIEVAVRRVAAAHVLHDHRITARDGFLVDCRRCPPRCAFRTASEIRGPGTCRRPGADRCPRAARCCRASEPRHPVLPRRPSLKRSPRVKRAPPRAKSR